MVTNVQMSAWHFTQQTESLKIMQKYSDLMDKQIEKIRDGNLNPLNERTNEIMPAVCNTH